MKRNRWLIAGLFLAIGFAGCSRLGDQVEIGTGGKMRGYQPSSTDVVNTHGDVKNLERYLEFHNNVKAGSPDKIRIASFTEEGDAIIHEMEFDGSVIHSVRDSRRDKFGQGEVVEMTCKSIEYVEDGMMANNMYDLVGCDKEDVDKSVIWY